MNDAWFKRLEDDGLLRDEIVSLGWGFWPQGTNGGYLDVCGLRQLADEIERRNKPFWDEYERYCIEQDQKFGEVHMHDEDTCTEVSQT